MRSLIVSCALATACASSARAQTWTFSPVTGHRYALTGRMTWKQAEAQAVSWRGHLVTIRTQAQNDWLVRTFGSKCWMGFTDEAKEGKWVWISGERVTFTRWDVGQPDNRNGNEHYAAFAGANPGHWKDLSGTAVARGIVERKSPRAQTWTFGRGCASTSSLPSIALSEPPIAGKTFVIRVRGFLPNRPGGLILGTSNTRWGFQGLPLSLAYIGMSGCSLWVSLDAGGPISTDSKGSFDSFPLSIPRQASWMGKVFYGQAFALDAKANALGIATTNAFKGVVGV